MAVVVVAAICAEAFRTPPWPAHLASDRRDTLDERDQLRDIVAVAARERPGERDPRCIDEEVVLRARSGSINWARARLGAPRENVDP